VRNPSLNFSLPALQDRRFVSGPLLGVFEGGGVVLLPSFLTYRPSAAVRRRAEDPLDTCDAKEEKIAGRLHQTTMKNVVVE